MRFRLPATIVLIVAMFMDLVDSTITNVALPAITRSLGAAPAQLEWMLAGYVITFAVVLISAGRLGDALGRRRVFVLGVAGFTLASLAAALSPSADVLVATRVVQGLFAGLMVPQVLATVQVLYEPEERAPVFGIIGSLTALGAVCGLLLGGWLVTADVLGTGWRAIFLVNVPVGVALVAAPLLLVPPSRATSRTRLDLPGVALGTVTVFLVVFPLTVGRQADWAAWVWAMLIASPLVLAAFVVQQRRRFRADGSALLPLEAFHHRGFSAGLVVQLLSSIGNGSYALVLIFYVQQALGFSALNAGLAIAPIAVGSMLASPLVVPLAARFGRGLMVAGGLIEAAAFVALMSIIGHSGAGLHVWEIAIPMTAVGIGMMCMIMPMMDLTLAEVGGEEAGGASGTVTTFAQIGMVLGIAVAGAIYFGITGSEYTAARLSEHAVTAALWIPVAAYVIAGAASLLMPARTALRPTPAERRADEAPLSA